MLKVSNSAEDPAIVEMENAAMEHIARHDPDLAIPRLVPSVAGAPTVEVVGDDGRSHLAQAGHRPARQPGRGCADRAVPGRSDRCRDGPDQPGPRGLLPRRRRPFSRVGHQGGPRSRAQDPARRRSRGRALLRATLARIAPTLDALGALPAQVEHADVTLTNVLVTDGRLTGVIDFGDMHHTAAVCDLACSLNSVVRSVAHLGWGDVRDVASALPRRLPAASLVDGRRRPRDR